MGGWLRAVLCPLQPGDAAAEWRDERRVALAERYGRVWAYVGCTTPLTNEL